MTAEHFQARSSRTGENFERAVEHALVAMGYTILGRKAERFGVEIDLIVIDPNDRELWIECKGGYQSPSKRNGGKRTDNVLKFLGCLWLLDRASSSHPPYILAVSAKPSSGRAVEWLSRAEDAGVNVWELPAMDFLA